LIYIQDQAMNKCRLGCGKAKPGQFLYCQFMAVYIRHKSIYLRQSKQAVPIEKAMLITAKKTKKQRKENTHR